MYYHKRKMKKYCDWSYQILMTFSRDMCVFFHEIVQTDIINTNLSTMQIKTDIKHREVPVGSLLHYNPFPIIHHPEISVLRLIWHTWWLFEKCFLLSFFFSLRMSLREVEITIPQVIWEYMLICIFNWQKNEMRYWFMLQIRI